VRENPLESIYGLLTVAVGLLIYFLTNKRADKKAISISPDNIA